MRLVKPEVYKIGETNLSPEWWDLLRAYGDEATEWGKKRFTVDEKNLRNDAELLLETAGRVCYKSFAPKLNPNVTMVRDNPKDYFKNILEKGDGSVLEHASVTFAFVNVSRVFTHEKVRHRIASYSQESLRYVRPTEIPITDPNLQKELDVPGSFEMFKEWQRVNEDYYKKMEGMFDWENMNFGKKKRLTSLLRRGLPQGMSTVIICTYNHRTLRWLIEVRTNRAAETEIRQVFDKVAEICVRDWPLIYQDFVKEQLPDGTFEWKPTLRSKV